MIEKLVLKSDFNAIFKEKKYGVLVSLLYILAAFPIIPVSVQSIVLVTFCFFAIILYSENFLIRLADKKILMAILVLVGFYVFSLISYIWSTDKYQFWKEIQPNICLLLLPVSGILFAPSIKSHLNNLLKVHILSLLLYMIGWKLYLIYSISYYHNHINDSYAYLKLSGLSSEIISNKFLLFFHIIKNFILDFKTYTSVLYEVQSIKQHDWFHFHYTYIACLFVNGILILYHIKSILSKKVFYFTLFAFIAFILYQGSKLNTFLLLIAISFFILHLLPKNLFKLSFLSAIMFGIILIFVYKERLINNSYIVYEKRMEFIDVIRKELYKSAIKVFQQNPVIGTGIGDVKNEVNRNIARGILVESNNEFVELGHIEKKNTHSQFFYYLAGTGIIGFLLYCSFFLYSIYTDRFVGYLACFAFLILFNSLFENFLSRFFGSLIFIFFPTIYLNSKLTYENKRN